MRRFLQLFVFAICLAPAFCLAQDEKSPETSAAAPAPVNLFAERFFMPSGERLNQKVQEIDEFLFLETPTSETRGRFAVVTDFQGGALR